MSWSSWRRAEPSPQQHCKHNNEQELHHSHTTKKSEQELTTTTRQIYCHQGEILMDHNVYSCELICIDVWCVLQCNTMWWYVLVCIDVYVIWLLRAQLLLDRCYVDNGPPIHDDERLLEWTALLVLGRSFPSLLTCNPTSHDPPLWKEKHNIIKENTWHGKHTQNL